MEDDFFSGLDSTPEQLARDSSQRRPPDEPTKSPARGGVPAGRHACFECNGSGFYQGVRLHQQKEHCFACKGKGYFMTSRAHRERARAKAAERKEAKAKAAVDAYREAHPGLIEGLEAVSHWNAMAHSLLDALRKYGSLTDKQVSAARSMLAKIAERKAEREAERAARTREVDTGLIEKMFEAAREAGLKRPRFTADGLTISRAPDTGRNAGSLYVKLGHEYAGKITGGRFYPTSGHAEIADRVAAIAADPLGAARLHGQKTGACSCCGRELTDDQSIAAGIGPVCAEKWGL